LFNLLLLSSGVNMFLFHRNPDSHRDSYGTKNIGLYYFEAPQNKD
jgi:hypothetical protein